MATNPGQDVTQILAELNQGSDAARAELLRLVYDELRRLATSKMRRERGDHALQPTALVHEAYIRLLGTQEAHWENRAHFFGAAAEALNISPRTVKRDWSFAKAWLFREINQA